MAYALEDISRLSDDYAALRAEQPKQRIRDAAHTLGVTEAELLQTGILTGKVRRLRRTETGFAKLLEALVDIGEVMCLTRNASAVHERYGEFDNCHLTKTMGLVLNRTIDLRVFMHKWAFGFVETQDIPDGTRLSLQFFNKHGEAVHKIYSTPGTDSAKLEALVNKWVTVDLPPIAVEPASALPPDAPDADMDAEAFRTAWGEMTDTHQFIVLLKKHGCGRMQALRLAGPGWARPAAQDSVTRALNIASETSVSVMIFIASDGCIQIHTDPVENIKPMGPWINVLDPKFHMHLRTDHIAHVWVVKKPVDTGFVHSLEAYDAENQLIFQMFGERKEGKDELPEWRALLDQLARG